MKLYLDGITRNTISPVLIAELKKAGYVEVVEKEESAPVSGNIDLSDGVSNAEATLASSALNTAKQDKKAGKK